MAQVRVLNDTLSIYIALLYVIANHDLLGTVEPRDAYRVSMLGLFHAIHQVMRSTMITGSAILPDFETFPRENRLLRSKSLNPETYNSSYGT